MISELKRLEIKAKRREWAERRAVEMRDHKMALAKEFGLEQHPKLDTLYSLAWNHGHSAGFAEVAHYFEEFSTLLT